MFGMTIASTAKMIDVTTNPDWWLDCTI